MSFYGKNIKKIRFVKKLSQTQFAFIFDLKRTAVGAYEEGRAEPKIETAIKTADFFKLSLDQLLRKELTVNDIFHFREDLLHFSSQNQDNTIIEQLVFKIEQLEEEIAVLKRNINTD